MRYIQYFGRNIRKFSSAVESPPVEVKETFKQRIVRFWKSAYEDYTDVALETVKDARARPLKASFYIGALGATLAAIASNPGEICFKDALTKANDDLLLISDTIRNPAAEAHVHHLATSVNEGTIRRLNLGVCSLIWLDNYDRQVGRFDSQCSYLKPRYVTFYERVIDIGFAKRFWVLQRVMQESDVNPHEWISSLSS